MSNGPVLLVLGLATRRATLPRLGMTFVTEVLVYPDLWLSHLPWATILAFILTKGLGPISLAALIFRRRLSAPRTASANSVR